MDEFGIGFSYLAFFYTKKNKQAHGKTQAINLVKLKELNILT
jgi:hypothetical protein